MGLATLWAILLSGPLTAAGALVLRRRTDERNETVRRRARWFWLATAALLALPPATYILTQDAQGVAFRSLFRQPLYLWAYPPLFFLLLRRMRGSEAALSAGRLWSAFFLRSLIVALLLLALAGLQWTLVRDRLTVIFVLDGSRSVTDAGREPAWAFIRQAAAVKPPDDEVGLVVFGGAAAAEAAPGPLFQAPEKGRITAEINPDATNIQAGLRRAAALFPEGARKRLVLFTDGRQTTGDAEEEMRALKARGADVWVAPLRRAGDAEILVEKLVAPADVKWGQPFDVNVNIRSDTTTNVNVQLFTGDASAGALKTRAVRLNPGRNRVTFENLRPRGAGLRELRAVVEPLAADADVITENNSAYAFVNVAAESRLLVLAGDLSFARPLADAVEGEKISLDIRVGASLPENPEEYRQFDGIILADIGRHSFGAEQLRVIEACVRDQGAGLVMIGGEQSFGAGGWLNSPVENALPVRMDLRNKRVMPSNALVLVLDRSGSMAGVVTGSNKTQQELANLAATAAISVLSTQDYVGVVAFDGTARVIIPLQPNAHPETFRKHVRSIGSGGGTDISAGLSEGINQFNGLAPGEVNLRHMILLTDGQDGGGNAEAQAPAARKQGITLTTVGLGDGCNTTLLANMARLGGGRFFHVKDPKTLPLIFLKEAAVIRKNLILSDENGIPVSVGAVGEILRDFPGKFPAVKALVVTSPKERAELHLFTILEGERVPLFARWQYGLGKAAAFTSGNTPGWGGDWLKWPEHRRFWVNLLRWVARRPMPRNCTVTAYVDGDQGRVVVEGIDKDGNYMNFAKLIGTAADPGVPRGEPDARVHSLHFEMTAPGRYEAAFPAGREGVYSVSITDASDPTQPSTVVTGVVKSCGPEFLHLEPDHALLRRLAEIAGGADSAEKTPAKLKDLTTLDPLKGGLFRRDLPPGREPTELPPYLLILALCLFPLDVAVRRLRWDPAVALAGVWTAFARLAARLGVKFAARPKSKSPPPTAPPLVPLNAETNRAALEEAAARYAAAGDVRKAEELLAQARGDGQVPTTSPTEDKPSAPETADPYMRALQNAKRKAKK